MNILVFNLNIHKLISILNMINYNIMNFSIYINHINDHENVYHNNFKFININSIDIIDIIYNFNIDLILTNFCFDDELYKQIISKKCEVILCNISNKIIAKKINMYSEEVINKKNIAINQYYSNSNLDDYLLFKRIPLHANLTKKISNAFDIDLNFFCYVNNIMYGNKDNVLKQFDLIGLDGLIYNPKQLFNLFGDNIDIEIEDNNNINILYKKNNKYDAKDFVRSFVYDISFDNLSQLLIEKSFDNLNCSSETIFLVFIANTDRGIELLNKIINYKKTINSEFNLAVCINKNINNNLGNIIKLITDNFEFYSIYYSCEMGQDITPTLLMYDNLKKKCNNIKHVFKFHTKSDINYFSNLTDYLLTNSLETIINSKRHDCNCIGHPHYYKQIAYHIDNFNNSLKEKYKNLINNDYQFVMATIFYTENIYIEKVINFIKENNFKSYLLNNLYEVNWITQANSPNHFLERLFGVIKI